MMPAHCALLMAPVPLSVSRSMMTSSERRAKMLNPASEMRPVRSSHVLSLIGSTALIRNGSMMVLNTGSSKMSLPRLAPLGSPDPGPLSAAVAVARPFLTEASRLPDRIRDRDVRVPARIDGSRSTNGQFVAEGYRRYSVMPVGRVTVNLPSVPDFTFSTTWPVLSREVARAAESTSTNRMPRTQPSLSVTAETPVAPRAFAKRHHCRTHTMPDVVAPLASTARAARQRKQSAVSSARAHSTGRIS